MVNELLVLTIVSVGMLVALGAGVATFLSGRPDDEDQGLNRWNLWSQFRRGYRDEHPEDDE